MTWHYSHSTNEKPFKIYNSPYNRGHPQLYQKTPAHERKTESGTLYCVYCMYISEHIVSKLLYMRTFINDDDAVGCGMMRMVAVPV